MRRHSTRSSSALCIFIRRWQNISPLSCPNWSLLRERQSGPSVRESRGSMKAARINKFGPPEVVVIEDLSRPNPGAGGLLVRVRAARVAPWDAITREGKSKVSPPPPLTLGSDLSGISGIVEEVGAGVTDFRVGHDVYGVTNAQFCGAHAEFAVASAGMVAKKPRSLSHLEGASVPVVAVTAWQMLFEYAHVVAGQSVLILGAGGNVGAYAVQFAARTGLDTVAIAGSKDLDFAWSLGAKTTLDYRAVNFEEAIPPVDVLIDTVGGETLERSFGKLNPAVSWFRWSPQSPCHDVLVCAPYSSTQM